MKKREVTDKYYKELEATMENIPNQQITALVEDANVKIIKEDVYRNVTGRESKPDTSNDSELQF